MIKRFPTLRTFFLGLVLLSPATAIARTPSFVPAPFRMLAAHNAERARWGVAPLTWSPALAAAAEGYAASMARTGRWGHSSDGSRPGQGENLWMGTRGAFPTEEMVGAWLAERRMFRPAVFPAVSNTGNWGDVGHYTQIISRRSTHVGCAIRSNQNDDYLVCRYWPSGNVMGMKIP
jgi:hypothetical protein